jgi:phytoene dehydrogenase-like protein
MLAHGVGWPVASGGSQKIAAALAVYLESLGGEIATNCMVASLSDLPPAENILFDLTPRQLLAIAGDALQPAYRRRLAAYRYGPGVCKVDWALDGPIPWRSADVNRAATVHLGGSLEEIAESERAVWAGEHPQQPFVLLAQQTLFDPSRAPAGKHTAWAYCHVPHASTRDVSTQIEDQIERFAPGFKDCILARKVHTAREMEIYNPNYVGGDINGGVQDYRQLFTRPAARWDPYTIPTQGGAHQMNFFLCSSSTPPGGGVHGMCGYHAARSLIRRVI